MIYRYLIVLSHFWMLNRFNFSGLWTKNINDKIYAAVLRTNRQIFSEASFLLYSETVATLRAEDIVCLRPGAKDLIVSKKCIWRHNPLHGIGQRGTAGEIIYDTPEMGGFLEPHVFSRFKHIVLHFFVKFRPRESFDFEPLQVDSQLKLIPDDRVRFRDLLRQRNIIIDFTEIISRSPTLTSLQIDLEISVWAAFNENFVTADGRLTDAYYDAVDTRAVEVFIESGVLDPLRELSNVDEASIDVLRTEDTLKILKLEPKYQNTLLDVEFAITCENSSVSRTENSQLHGGNESDVEKV